MADIIVQWLGDRIGCIIEVNSCRFAEAMKSGILLAHIFYSYGLFSDEQVQEVVDGRMNILEVYKAYLKKMDIIYNDEIHEKITSGNTSVAMKLLYHLYLCLQSKDKLQHIAVAERKKIMMTGTDRFSVTPVCEAAKFVPRQDVHPFSQPLRSLKHIVRWHKEKHQSFMDRCRKDRQEYILQLNAQLHDKNISCKGITPLQRKSFVANVEVNDDFDNSSVDLSYDQLISSQKKYEDVSITLPNPEEAEKLLNKLTMRMQKKRASDATGIKLKRALLSQLWDRVLKQQLETFENSVIDEALKQSIFEKQMVRKAFDIRQQKDTMFQNRHHIDEAVKKAAEENFCWDLYHSEALNEEKENLYYLEKNRAYELHRRLYAERQRLILEKTTEMCRVIVNDFADIAMYTAEYKANYQVECSTMQKLYLSTLFQHEKQIFDNILPIEDILNYDPEDCSEELEEIYAIELSRHDAIMDNLLNDYLAMNWPWQINLADSFSPEELDLWHLGTNVLGHIVHRLLLAKYPKPVPPPPPDLPAVPIAVCLNGLTNLAIINPLKEILREKQIEVIEMQDAINYCLKVFNEETTIEYTDTLFEQEERAVQELEKVVSLKVDGKGMKRAKKQIKKVKTKPPKKGSKMFLQNQSVDAVSSKEDIIPKIAFPPFANKSAQTPKLFPWEQIVHSAAGELGRVAYNIVNAGEPLHMYLTVKMFVQYLISLKSKNIGGWVLVNFPNTISDATHLEEELSNLPVPCPPAAISEPDLNDYVKIADKLEVPENQLIEESNVMKRRSKILPNPIADDTPEYKTTLTAFIALKQITEEEQLKFEQFIIETPTDPLQAFYYNQGCKYDLWLKLWDFRTLKTLAKLIIGNFSLPRQRSVEMLGPSVEYLEAMLDIPTGIDISPLVHQKAAASKKGAAKGKASKSSKVSASTTNVEDNKNKKASTKTTTKVDNQKKKGKKGKGNSSTASDKFDADGGDAKLQLPLVYHKETQIPEVEQVEDIIEVELDEPKEANWQYVMCSIPEEFQCSLATLWENVEEVYVNDLKELFFRRRILLDSVIPYIAFIKAHMQRFITRPDMKQKHLHDFQLQYNQLDQDMRDDEELKAEIHCRIFEFKNVLHGICDERMQENEGERQRLIEDNWPTKTMIQIINVKTTMMQIEIDAFVDTLRLITEYYYGMVTKRPVAHIELNKLRLNKIVYDEETPDNLIVKLISYTDQLLKSKEPISSNSCLSPFEDIIIKTYEKAMEFALQTHQYILQYVSSLAVLFKPKDANKKEIKPKPVIKKGKMDPKKMPSYLIPDSDIIECSNNLLEEFKYAIEAAYIVIQMRLNINLLASKKLFHSILIWNKDAFLFIYHAIEQRYEREVNSVELACSILSRAVEAECKIQPQLILAGDEFLVEPDVLLFEDDLPIHAEGMQEAESKYIYSMQQLQDTLDLFKLYAPNGFLLERVFTFILQDIVIHNPEDGSPWLIPSLWRQLQPQQVSMLTKDLFGNTEYIDWREYILFNLTMRFPKIHEILAMRYFFREMDPDDTELVYEHQYQIVSLWFEKSEYNLDQESDSAAVLRHKLTKTLLWHCYKIDEQRINYIALLLALCKGRWPVNGIAKALSLSLGKEVCGNYKLGEMYLKAELDKRQRLVWQEAARQIEHEDNIKVAEEVLEQMTESVLDECDSERLVLEEIRSTAENDVQAAAATTAPTAAAATSLEDSDNNSLIDILQIELTSTDDELSQGPDEVFSNVEIGFEEFDFPNLVYILQFDDLINVFATALPYIFSKQSVGDDKGLRENLEVLYKSLRIPDLDNNVYVHRFLHSPELVQLMTDISKFSTRYPVNTVFEMLKIE